MKELTSLLYINGTAGSMILPGTQYYHGYIYFLFVLVQGGISRMLMAIGYDSRTIDSTVRPIYTTPSAFPSPFFIDIKC